MTENETDPMVTVPVLGSFTYREWHEFVNGVYSGARWGVTAGNDHQHEYWRGGYLLGTLCRYTALAIAYERLTASSTE